MERGKGSRDGPYRDGIEWIRARYLDRRVVIAEMEGRLSESFWEIIPSKTGRRLKWLQKAASPEDESADAIIRAEAGLEAYEQALRKAIKLIPDIEREQRRLPDYAPDLVPARWMGRLSKRISADIVLFGEKLASIIQKQDANASISSSSAVGFCAKFNVEGCPFTLLAELELSRDVVDEPPFWGEVTRVTVATSVASGLSPLRLTPEMWSDSILKALRIKRDVEIGDESFDGLFLVDADVEPARTILSPRVRAALLSIARFDVPTLSVGSGEAVLRFTYELSGEPILAAIRALVGVRRTSPMVKLMLDEDGVT